MRKIARPVLIAALISFGMVLAPPAAAKGGDIIATKGAVVSGADGFGGIAVPGGEGARYFVLPNGLAKLEGERIDAFRSLPRDLSIPAVTVNGEAGGLSADGKTLVLANPANPYLDRSELLVVDTGKLRTTEEIRLEGSFIFDAISPDGSLIYLVHLFDPRNPLDYDVRIYDVEAGRMLREPVVDPSEPDEQMGGYPYARAASPDSRWAYTLYDGGHEPFIHALDTVGRTAVCVDLDELGVPIGGGSTLVASEDGGTLLLGRRGETVATVDTSSWEVTPVSAEAPDDAGGTAEAPAAGEASGDPWILVAGIALLTLLTAAVLRWKAGPGREPGQPAGAPSTPSDSRAETNASTSARARSGSTP